MFLHSSAMIPADGLPCCRTGTVPNKPNNVLWRSALFLCACGFLLPGIEAWALTPQEIYRQAQGQVLVLESFDEKDAPVSFHTALLLETGKAVAACDVLEGVANIKVRRGEAVYAATLERRDSTRNLCLLSVSGMAPTAALHLNDRDPEVGAPIYALSNALGLGIGIAEGVVSGVRQSKGESYIQFTAAIAPGSEGGGLFDAQGRLVGVINYRQRDGQNVNFAVPARWLKEIDQRAASTDAAVAWRAKALVLEREAKWTELATHAAEWSKALTDSAEAWFWSGFAYQQHKDWVAAEHAYRETQRREPAAVQAGIGLATVLLLQNKPKEALDVARSMLVYRQEDAKIWFIIGSAQNQLGQADEAKQAFERATQIAPWDREAYAGLLSIARLRGDWPAAVAAQRQVARVAPDDGAVWAELAEVYLRAGRPERAFASAGRAVELSPASGDAWLFKGMALHALKRQQEALEALKKALTLQPQRPAWAWAGLAEIYYGLGLYPEAIAAFREAFTLEPDNRTQGRLGVALKDNFQFKEAFGIFEKLKIDTPTDPFPWRQIGFVHGSLAQWEAAIPAYEQALKLDPKQPKVWRTLMESYHAVGRQDDVKRAYQQLLAVDRTWAEQAYRDLMLPYGVMP
jgi:tetratricopeptide (TPR) repeat protein